MIRFAHPWLLVVGLPLLAFVIARVFKVKRDVGRARPFIAIAMVGGALCASLALAGLEAGSARDQAAIIFVVDRSRSAEGADDPLDAVRAATEGMPADDLAGVVVFGASAATHMFAGPRSAVPPDDGTVSRNGTKIADGLRRALSDVPEGYAGRLVLMSDGLQTSGDALDAAVLARGRGVSIDVVPIERPARPEIAVEQVRVPQTAHPGEPVELRVVTRANAPTPVRVRVTRDGTVIAAGETTIEAGSDVLVLRDTAPERGVARYGVEVTPVSGDQDGSALNNEGGAFLRVVGESRALLVAGPRTQSDALADAIGGPHLEVVTRDALPSELSALSAFDLVILDDLPARTLSRRQMRDLRSYVRDLGGGLLMLGARDSFGLGGYARTPVEEALPATFDLRQRRDRLSLAMVIAIDQSGSMGMVVASGQTKLDLANEAAARSAELLSSSDRVGILHVDTAPHWTQPMTNASDSGAIASRARSAEPGGGGIDVDVAMAAAYGTLRSEQTQLRHFLLFSDGNDSQNLAGMREVVRQAHRQGITTSIVSMGNGTHTPELEVLSGIGEGRFYIVDNMEQLPRIFTEETIQASKAALSLDPAAVTSGAPGAVTQGIDLSAAPDVTGHVVMNARPRATTYLFAGEDPLLAVWQHGIGRGAVFGADSGTEFTKAWLSWPGYRTLFHQVAREILRAPGQADARVSVSIQDGVGEVVVEAIGEGGRYRNYLDLGGSVSAPGGQSIEVELSQTGAGRYTGRFDASSPGPYFVTVREEDRAALVGTAGVVRPRGDELRGEGTDHALLAQLAAVTGGKIRADLSEVFSDRPPHATTYSPLFRPLTIAALVLFFVSVVLRRVVFRFGRRPTASGHVTTAADPKRRAVEPRSPRSSTAEPEAPTDAASPAEEPSPPDEPTNTEPETLAEQLLKKRRRR